MIKPLRLIRSIRFSLRSLLLLVLLITAAGGLWWRWEPWVLATHCGIQAPVNRSRCVEAGAALSPDRTRLCWRAMDGRWRLYDTRRNELLWTREAPTPEYLLIGNSQPGIAFVGDGKLIAIARVSRPPLRPHSLLRAQDGALLPEDDPAYQTTSVPSDRESRSSVAASYSPDRSKCIERGAGSGWVLLNRHANKVIGVLPSGAEPCGTCFSVDGTRLATVGYAGIVRIHDAANGQLLYQLAGCPMGRCVEFSEDGNTLLVVGRGWDVWLFARRRPEYWWGIAWLPEFWLIILFGLGLIVSVWCDRGRFRVCPIRVG